MPSAAPSAPETLAGPVAVCIDRPLLALDRPFTYRLDAAHGAGVGSLVRVRFHGSATRAWVLGRTDELPPKISPVLGPVSPVRFFDEEMLAFARWVATRYVAPLATILGRLAPPRVAGEEAVAPEPEPPATGAVVPGDVLGGYRGGGALVAALAGGSGGFLLRPEPDAGPGPVLQAVEACLRGGRRAIVLVPEAAPLPATARAVLETFGDRAVSFMGGDRRTRYRAWLRIAAGEPEVVVGTRPAVYAPVTGLGLVWVSRESHPGHREERAPATHVRDLALQRARSVGGVLVLEGLTPSAEAVALGLPEVAPSRRAWPKVEVVRPGPEGRARRVVQLLPEVRRGFILSAFTGYGLAQVCRTCGEPAACTSCAGTLRLEEGSIVCVVCGAAGRCRSCGGSSFAIRRGGAERIVEWASRVAGVPVRAAGRPRLPRAREIVVGDAGDVRDLGSGELDLVAIVDADAGLRRPGLAGRERTLATWMDAAAWAAPSGRVVVATEDPADPVVQAVVRGDARRFHERERERRAEAGFPVGSAVFRIVGDERLEAEIGGIGGLSALVTSLGGRTVCLVALAPGDVARFGATMRSLAVAGVVERVDAEPHL
jgi:primosomal protein N' (replication factor Y)